MLWLGDNELLVELERPVDNVCKETRGGIQVHSERRHIFLVFLFLVHVKKCFKVRGRENVEIVPS